VAHATLDRLREVFVIDSTFAICSTVSPRTTETSSFNLEILTIALAVLLVIVLVCLIAVVVVVLYRRAKTSKALYYINII